MKCIYKQYAYAKEHYNGYKLHVRNRKGEDVGRLFDDFEELRLIVKAGHYRLENKHEEIFRQGKCDGTPTEIFAIYDSIPADIPTEIIQLETDDYSGSFEGYELEHGHGRIPRDVKTKWKAYSETLPDDADYTAIGLVKYDRQTVYEIHSLYIPKRLGRRKKSHYVVDFVHDRLAANEYANIAAVGINPMRTDDHHLRGELYRDFYELPRLLHDDAAERRGTVSEVIPEGMTYTAEGLFPNIDEVEAEKEVRESV